MISNHIDAKLTFAIPYGVNRNGSCLTKETIENALKNLKSLPIVNYTNTDDNVGMYGSVCGSTYGGAENVEWDDKNQQCRITVGGILYNAGAEILPREIVDGEITSMHITCINLSEAKETDND